MKIFIFIGLFDNAADNFTQENIPLAYFQLRYPETSLRDRHGLFCERRN